MRSFLAALICLSTLVSAQNVLAISPASDSEAALGDSHSVAAGSAFTRAGDDVDSQPAAPEPTTMGLFVVGLAGLTAAGSRSRRPAPDDDSARP